MRDWLRVIASNKERNAYELRYFNIADQVRTQHVAVAQQQLCTFALYCDEMIWRARTQMFCRCSSAMYACAGGQWCAFSAACPALPSLLS